MINHPYLFSTMSGLQRLKKTNHCKFNCWSNKTSQDHNLTVEQVLQVETDSFLKRQGVRTTSFSRIGHINVFFGEMIRLIEQTLRIRLLSLVSFTTLVMFVMVRNLEPLWEGRLHGHY